MKLFPTEMAGQLIMSTTEKSSCSNTGRISLKKDTLSLLQ